MVMLSYHCKILFTCGILKPHIPLKWGFKYILRLIFLCDFSLSIINNNLGTSENPNLGIECED